MEVSIQLHAPTTLYPGRKAPDAHWIGGWVSSRSGLEAVEYREISCRCREFKSGRPVRSLWLYQLSCPDSCSGYERMGFYLHFPYTPSRCGALAQASSTSRSRHFIMNKIHRTRETDVLRQIMWLCAFIPLLYFELNSGDRWVIWRVIDPCNRPWRPIMFWDVGAPTFSRQSTHRWRWCCQPYAPDDLTPRKIPDTHFW
jgi:hypothetical protein